MYPNKSQALWLIFTLIGLEIILASVLALSGSSWLNGNPLGYILIAATACGIVVYIAKQKMKQPLLALLHANFNDARTLVLLSFLPLVLVCVGGHVLIANLEGIYYYFSPQDSKTTEYLKQVINSGVLGFIAIVIIAPVVEELVFRGIILRGLLANYKRQDAMVSSAIFFAFAHLNPDQLIPTLIIGYFFAWLYVQSYSLWPSILAHMIVNCFAYLIYTSEEQIKGINHFPAGELALPSFTLQIFGLITLSAGIYLLLAALKRANGPTN